MFDRVLNTSLQLVPTYRNFDHFSKKRKNKIDLHHVHKVNGFHGCHFSTYCMLKIYQLRLGRYQNILNTNKIEKIATLLVCGNRNKAISSNRI